MTKLSNPQAVILSTASQREDGAVLPLPETLKIKGGALDKVLGSLKAKGLIDQQGTPRGDDPPSLCITRAGLEAIAVASEDGADSATAEAPDAEAQAKAAQHKAEAVRPNKAALADQPTPRAGTKQALMIELLKRPEGATVEQIAAATGWQHHTVRGAISGTLKKKLGLAVEATRTREVGRNKARAKGRATVYRITGSSPRTGSGSEPDSPVRQGRQAAARRPAARRRLPGRQLKASATKH
jgi:Protein of unknown function (DUF3489)